MRGTTSSFALGSKLEIIHRSLYEDVRTPFSICHFRYIAMYSNRDFFLKKATYLAIQLNVIEPI